MMRAMLTVGVLLAVGIGVRLYHQRVMPLSIDHPAPVVAAVASANYQFMVQVSGAVRHPGVYAVAPSARLLDAVKLAGGVLPDGDVSGLNFANRITDGQHVVIPYRQSGLQSGSSLVSINTASAVELETIPGIGPAMAQRIVAYRAEHGGYSSLQELTRVSGIGEKKLNSIKQYISI